MGTRDLALGDRSLFYLNYKWMKKPEQWQIGAILVIGVLAVSSAAIFIRLSMGAAGLKGVDFSLFIAASRLILSALILVPLWRNIKSDRASGKAYYYAAAAGGCLALHFASWITSLSFTSIAASTILVTTNPVWVAMLSWLWLKEKPKKLVIIGIGVAFLGGIFIAIADKNVVGVNTNPLLGDLLALTGAWMASLYLLLGRQAQAKGLGIGQYIVIAYSTAAIVLFPLPWIFGSGYVGYPYLVYAYVLLMAIFSQLIGHTSFNWSVRWVSPTIVTLALLFEPVCSSVFGFLVFEEIPSLLVLVGGVGILLGVAIAIIGQNRVVESRNIEQP